MDFEIGTRVIGIGTYEGEDIQGLHGTIVFLPTSLGTEETYCVEFDEELVDGHTGRGNGRDRHCWWCPPDQLFLAIKQLRLHNNPIINKTRKLWNNSKYVKNHPTVEITA